MTGKRAFVDTSGFLALLDADDEFHLPAKTYWEELLRSSAEIITTDYVRLESWALIQRRLGAKAAICFHDSLLPVCRIETVGEQGFDRAVAFWRVAHRKNLSIVDLTSFDCMRHAGIHTALCFDRHFSEQGFEIPS